MCNAEGMAWVLAKHAAHVVLRDISKRVFETAKALESENLNESLCRFLLTDK
jgi:hypothetical protein